MTAMTEEKKWTRIKTRQVLGPVLAVLGLLYTYHSHVTGCPRQVILGAWAIVPPIWFGIEYWLFDREKESAEDFEFFKYTQQLGRNFWMGIVTLLAILYLGKWD